MVDSAHSPHPYPGNVFSGREVVIRQYSPTRLCPAGIQDYTLGARPYFRCLDQILWHHGVALLTARHATQHRDVWLYLTVYACALAALAAFATNARAPARLSLRRRPSPAG